MTIGEKPKFELSPMKGKEEIKSRESNLIIYIDKHMGSLFILKEIILYAHARHAHANNYA